MDELRTLHQARSCGLSTQLRTEAGTSTHAGGCKAAVAAEMSDPGLIRKAMAFRVKYRVSKKKYLSTFSECTS